MQSVSDWLPLICRPRGRYQSLTVLLLLLLLLLRHRQLLLLLLVVVVVVVSMRLHLPVRKNTYL